MASLHKKSLFLLVIGITLFLSGCDTSFPLFLLKKTAFQSIDQVPSWENTVSNECQKDDGVTPLRFCEITMDQATLEQYLQWNFLEIQSNDNYIVIVRYNNWELQPVHLPAIIKDKQSGKFFISNHSLWDVAFSPDGKSMFAGVIFDIDWEDEVKSLQKISGTTGLETDTLKKSFTDYVNEDEVSNLSVLVKISLPKMEVSYLPYTGGEEIQTKGTDLIFTQYDPDWPFCLAGWELPDENFCNNNFITTLTVDEKTLQKTGSTSTNIFNKVKSRKDMVFIDLYSNNDQEQLQRALKMLW